MNGMEIMINSLLKSMKIDPEVVKAKITEVVGYAQGMEARMASIEAAMVQLNANQAACLVVCSEVLKHLNGEKGVTHNGTELTGGDRPN